MLPGVRRLAAAVGSAILAGALTVPSAHAALEVAVSVSPPEGVVGRPIEVLVRTFSPVDGSAVGLPSPSLPYPAPSGLWNVLYPISDYPFDVVAESPFGESTSVAVARDPADASLWRGTFTPTAAGTWTITIRNFPRTAPTAVPVVQGGPPTTESAAPLVGVAGLLGGLLAGIVVGRRIGRPVRYGHGRE
jgi:hypothetical protein